MRKRIERTEFGLPKWVYNAKDPDIEAVTEEVSLFLKENYKSGYYLTVWDEKNHKRTRVRCEFSDMPLAVKAIFKKHNIIYLSDIHLNDITKEYMVCIKLEGKKMLPTAYKYDWRGELHLDY